jgi:steroid delta-isomerase-like uncharacterized protein
MSTGELHRAVYEAVPSRDFDRLREIYAADCSYTVGDGVEWRGVDAVLASVEAFTRAFPDLAIEIRRHHLPGDGVSIVEYTFAGTHRGELEGLAPTGRRMEVVACSVAEIRDGRIQRERDYYDTLALMEQLGADRDRTDVPISEEGRP